DRRATGGRAARARRRLVRRAAVERDPEGHPAVRAADDLRRAAARRRHRAPPARGGGDDRGRIGDRLPRAPCREHHGDDEAHGRHRRPLAAGGALALGAHAAGAARDSLSRMTDEDLRERKRLFETVTLLRTLERLNRLVSSSLYALPLLGAIARATADV